jgi:hypothetical protein
MGKTKQTAALFIFLLLLMVIVVMAISVDSSYKSLESVRSDDDLIEHYEGGMIIHTENAYGRYYDFIVNNQSTGPYGEEAPLSSLLPGDIIQLQNKNGRFYHSLVLTMIKTVRGRRVYYICAHDNDAFQRNLNTYNYAGLRGIHILGART